MQSRLHEYRIFARWEHIVGPAIARHARPKTLRGGRLYLVVDSPAWMQQLALMKSDMMVRLNKELGRDTVREMSFTLGEIAASPVQATGEVFPPIVLTAADRERIEQYVRDISDRDTREAFRSLLEKDVAHKNRTAGRQ